jgi:ubiquitin-protein ligase E3 C
MNLVSDLATLDQELFKNLMFLKSYEGDIGDLDLTFSITDTAMGTQTEIDLVTGGRKLSVTSKNRHRYINVVAKHYLYDRLKRQARAFFNGLYQVIQPDLLSIFCAPELQVLISGANTGVSLEDLKRNTRYAAGYRSIDRYIGQFWDVVEELSVADRGLLVKFVTSCERPPSLGFSSLQPPFTVQRIDCRDDLRLPTASTCFNTLKLPTYSSQKVLKDRLLTSIRSGAGFDLS